MPMMAMNRRATNGSLVVLFLLGLGLFAGCDKPPPEITLVAMDLTPCLGAVESGQDSMSMEGDLKPIPSTCREQLTNQLDVEAAVNVCLAVRSANDEDFSVGFKFSDGRLGPPLGDVQLPPGKKLKVALFFLTKGGSLAVCDAFKFDTECADNEACLLRLFDSSVTPDEEGRTIIRFAQDETDEQTRCRADLGPALSPTTNADNTVPVERCDGKDNDCDRRIDEGFQEGERDDFVGKACERGVGACNRPGKLVCGGDGIALECDAPVVAPENPGVDPCNEGEPIDDDCDGKVDEGSPACFVCNENADCIATNQDSDDPDVKDRLFCINNRCEVCDPGADDAPADSLNHPGCTINELCCRSEGKIACIPVSKDQCGSCNSGCGIDSDGCIERECSCGTDPSCQAPQGFCVEGACIQCRADSPNDCAGNELCCDTRCVETNALTGCEACDTPCGTDSNRCLNRTCVCGDDLQSCQAVGREYCALPTGVVDDTLAECMGCRDENDCPNGGKCIADPNQPILRQCVECTSRFDCNQPGKSECIDNRCVACNPDVDTYDGCDPAGLTPVCRRSGADNLPSCQPCTDDLECRNNTQGDNGLNYCVEGRCRACDPVNDDGCGQDLTKPICHGPADDVLFPNGNAPEHFQCRGCEVSADCGEGRECEDSGRCAGCVPDTGAGCSIADVHPICDPDARACRGCQANECQTAPGLVGAGRPFCVTQALVGQARCQECDSNRGQENGCDAAGDKPYCNENGTCQDCEIDRHCSGLYGESLPYCIQGRCQPCRLSDNSGCDRSSAEPVCVQNPATGRLACGGCTANEQCSQGLDPNAGAIIFCEPENGRCGGCQVGPESTGCDKSGSEPFCDGGACRGCENDNECPLDPRVNDGRRMKCDVDGFCRECLDYDNSGNSGCDPSGPTPFCDPRTDVCVACDLVSRPCDRIAGAPPVCVEGTCRECQPDTNLGCDEQKPICGRDFKCTGCSNDAQCANNNAGHPYCDSDGECSVCDPNGNRGCDDPQRPICDPDTKTCRPCTVATEATDCPGLAPRCVAGACHECDPIRAALNDCNQDRNGVPGPICDISTKRCRACTGQFECGSLRQDLNKAVCVDNHRCEVCDPTNNTGCGADTPICDGSPPSCRACIRNEECQSGNGLNSACVGGRCVGCNVNDPSTCSNPSLPICNPNNECEPCSTNQQCSQRDPSKPICIGGTCQECETGSSRGCDIASDKPVCIDGPDGPSCQGCTQNGACEIHSENGNLDAPRNYCFENKCLQCSPEQAESCPSLAAGVCRNYPDVGYECGPCDANQNPCPVPGMVCVNVDGRGNECHVCNPRGNNNSFNADCTEQTPICALSTQNDRTYECRPCRVGANECGSNICYNGECEACNPLTHEGCDNPAAPICDPATLTCKACEAGSNECARRDDRLAIPDGKRVCSAGRCVVCSAVTNEGCDADSNRPVCNDTETLCRGCEGQGAGNCGDQGNECLPNGKCSGCDPSDNSGCPKEAPRCTGDPATCGACATDDDCATRFPGTVCYNGQCTACNPDRAEGNQGCGNDRCCLDGEGVPGCVGVLASQYCESCNVNDSCGAGADICTAYECRCGALPACQGETPICADQNGVSQCVACAQDADCANSINTPFCRNNQCVSCADAQSDCGNNLVCVAGGALDGSCGECSPNGPPEDGCNLGSNVPYCSPDLAQCLGCQNAPNNVNACQNNPNGSVCINTAGSPLLGQCLECNPADAQDNNCSNPEPTCGANGQCRTCQNDNECPNGVRCRNDGTCR